MRLSEKEIIALNRIKLGGLDAMRTPTYSVHCSTITSLMRKGYLDKHGPTTKAERLMDTFSTKTPMS